MSLQENRLKEFLSSSEKKVIELGCGPNKKPGVFGIDGLDLDGVDYVFNLEEGLPFLPDNSVDHIISRHFLEHIENFDGLLKDIHRVLKPGGIKEVYVPHFSNPYYYSDPTHKRFFGLYTFDYYSQGHPKYKRRVPSFYGLNQFEVLERKLVFRSPFFGRNIVKRLAHHFYNLTPYLQEFYEENHCYFIPCQELKFMLRPKK